MTNIPPENQDKRLASPENGPKTVFTSESPCTSVCLLNTDGMCVGCFRTSDEIGGWSSMSETQRRQTNAKCSARRDESLA